MKTIVVARGMRRFHLVAVVVWVLLVPPTLLLWRDSVPWLNFMSVYAILTGHAAAWQASRTEVKQEESDDEP